MVKFVILALPRTGTTVICNSLFEHPDVLLYGELFHTADFRREMEATRKTLGAGISRGRLDHSLPVCGENDDGYSYLKKVYSQDVPFRALGFKMLLHHALNGPNARSWKFLAEHRDIRAIHIFRENLLEIIISFARACRSQQWHTDKTFKANSFELPVSFCEKNFILFTSAYKARKALFNSHPLLNLDYSEIKNNFTGCMGRISSFLELGEKITFTPRLKKIASLNPSEEISNYEELKKYFKDTEFNRYFLW